MTAELAADGNAPSPRPGPAQPGPRGRGAASAAPERSADGSRQLLPLTRGSRPRAPANFLSSASRRLPSASPPPYGPERAASHLRQSTAASPGVPLARGSNRKVPKVLLASPCGRRRVCEAEPSRSRAGIARGILVPRVGHCRENGTRVLGGRGLPGGDRRFALSELCEPDTCG